MSAGIMDQENADKKSPDNRSSDQVQTSRTPLVINFGKVFFGFTFYSFCLFFPVLFVTKMFFPEKYFLISGIGWLNCYAAGIVSFIVSYLIQRKCGELNIGAIAMGMFIRSGFPLMMVLALIPLLDNIILIRVGVLTLACYVLMLPAEVYLMIPTQRWKTPR